MFKDCGQKDSSSSKLVSKQQPAINTVKDEKFWPRSHKSKIIDFLQIYNFAVMIWVKWFYFWPCWKWKSVISCWNKKMVRQIFDMLQSTWTCIRKSKKVEKMLEEKLVIFALDPKLDWVIVTLILTSAPKFLWLVVHFDK